MMKAFLSWRFATLLYKLLGISFIVIQNKEYAIAQSDCNASKGLIYCPTSGLCLTRDQFCSNMESCGVLTSNINCARTLIFPKYLSLSSSDNNFGDKLVNSTYDDIYLQGKKQIDTKHVLRNKRLLYLKYPNLIRKSYKLPMMYFKFSNKSNLIFQVNLKKFFKSQKILPNNNKTLLRTLDKRKDYSETSLQPKKVILPRVKSLDSKNSSALKNGSYLYKKNRRFKRQQKSSKNSTAAKTKNVDLSLILSDVPKDQEKNQTTFRPCEY
ncbi:hypothetical protein Anas_06819 [Armadillidium nasatum]|uniref:Uncharacterized protein n=1 Tax=Armadillidium nasatum TaxID=96803 RepID=A0A5N5T4B7_9CRUS|nr:hypothetical protein Anas_06819 [Armadillidium nasatum]